MARLEDSVDRVNYEGGLPLRVNNLRFLKNKKDRLLGRWWRCGSRWRLAMNKHFALFFLLPISLFFFTLFFTSFLFSFGR